MQKGHLSEMKKAMANLLPDGNVAKSPIKPGSSFNTSSMESSPASSFPSAEFDGQHLQSAQGPWHQSAAAQLESPFGLIESHSDTRRLQPTFFSSGADGYGSTQFGSPLVNPCTWDNKLPYMSSATGIAGNPLNLTGNTSNITGHAQLHTGLAPVNAGHGHLNAGLDYMHTGLAQMHAGHGPINGNVSLRKMMMLPQSTPELFKQGNWASLNVGASLDPSSEGLTAQGMSLPASHCLPNLSVDPGFADRAARFSSFGNIGYSECHSAADGAKEIKKATLIQIKPVGQNTLANHSTPSSPNGFNNGNISNAQESIRFHPLKEASSALPLEEANRTLNMLVDCEDGAQKPFCTSVNESDESMGQEVSSSCEKTLGGGAAPMQGLSESIGRKRKAGSQKLKDGGGSLAANPKELDPDEGRSKSQPGSDNLLEKTPKPSNSGNSGDSTPKSVKEGTKPPEAPKPDFIHVRARRGQATDSHSLAERVRREKISERMKFLQDLVPGCSKVTGKAVMLDEIINYVQSLQRQVEFLSMKLASVNPRVEFNIDNLFQRERPVQPRVATPSSVFGLENANLYPPLPSHQQPHVPLQPLVGQCPPLEVQSYGSDPALRRTISMPASADAYMDSASQVSQAWDDELQSVVQMSFAQRQAALDMHGKNSMRSFADEAFRFSFMPIFFWSRKANSIKGCIYKSRVASLIVRQLLKESTKVVFYPEGYPCGCSTE